MLSDSMYLPLWPCRLANRLGHEGRNGYQRYCSLYEYQQKTGYLSPSSNQEYVGRLRQKFINQLFK